MNWVTLGKSPHPPPPRPPPGPLILSRPANTHNQDFSRRRSFLLAFSWGAIPITHFPLHQRRRRGPGAAQSKGDQAKSSSPVPGDRKAPAPCPAARAGSCHSLTFCLDTEEITAPLVSVTALISPCLAGRELVCHRSPAHRRRVSGTGQAAGRERQGRREEGRT